jgi:hypothetical protein
MGWQVNFRKDSCMRIREATAEDKAAWDTFADTAGGKFGHCFDWKYVIEAGGHRYIPLLAETAASAIIGILPVIKRKRYLSSILHSETHAGGLLLKRELSDTERYEVISALLKYVDTNYSRGCSRFILRENLSSISELSEEPTAALIDSGYRFRYDASAKLPCTFVLELKQPFEENIWKGLWPSKLRNKLNRAGKGVVVIHDREFSYTEKYIDMFFENCKRHGAKPYATRDQIRMELNIFRDKAKLFVALLEGQPIVAQLSYYDASTCFLWEIGSSAKDTGRANMLCDKAAIEDACDAGCRFLDFGFTATSSLAEHKEQFKGTRVPFRTYEKRYSIPRTFVELVLLAITRAWHDKTYLWKKRRKLWDSIVRW